jgi:hypothetical protein
MSVSLARLTSAKIWLALVALAQLPTLGSEPAESRTYDLRPAQAASWHQQAKVVVEVEGNLKLNPDGSAVQHMPLKVEAELNYVERTLEAGAGLVQVRTVRSYSGATAKIRLRETELNNTLRDERLLVVSQSDAKQATAFSPLGPLTRDELDLLDVPASGLSLGALLPQQAVAVNASWPIPDWAVARLFGLEAVSQHDATGKLVDVKDNVATIELAGKVAGAVGGVSSDIELAGKLNFDFPRRAVTWLALGYKENRAIGHAQPGYNVAAKVRMIVAPIGAAAVVSDQALARLPLEATPATTLVEFTAESAGFRLAHDRRWNVMTDRRDGTILRLVDRGDLIAQCNISPLPTLPAGQQLSLAAFEGDVKGTLGKSFGQIVEAAQEEADGLRILRVIVSGATSDLPIQWSYCHVSDSAGNRLALVFTIEGSLVERYAQIDRELVGGLRMVAKRPTPAAAGPEVEAAEKVEPAASRK